MEKENVKKLTTTTIINPYLLVSIADTGSQVIILGYNHLNKVGLTFLLPALHRDSVICNVLKKSLK
jgi:hypothetical protein